MTSNLSHLFHTIQGYHISISSPEKQKTMTICWHYIEHTSCNPSSYPLFTTTFTAAQLLIQFASNFDQFLATFYHYNSSLQHSAWQSLPHPQIEFYSLQVYIQQGTSISQQFWFWMRIQSQTRNQTESESESDPDWASKTESEWEYDPESEDDPEAKLKLKLNMKMNLILNLNVNLNENLNPSKNSNWIKWKSDC